MLLRRDFLTSSLIGLLLTSLACMNLGAGCVGTPTQSVVDGNTGLDPANYPDRRIQGEPNDAFNQAVDIVVDESGHASLQGTIGSTSDVDVYSLGPMSAGDRIVVDAASPSGALDSALAIFDEAGRLIIENDDRNVTLNQLDPFINHVFRADGLVHFLAISSAPLGPSSGTYNMTVQVARGGVPPPAVPQIIVLDFLGGSINIPGDRTYTVGVFNASDISSAYSGTTPIVRNQIVQTVRSNFEGLAVSVLVVPGDTAPPGCTGSRVLFGGRNPDAYGTSQKVDSYNADPCDASIIFTEMFTPSRFGRTLSAEELGIAIGNVATHEVGHLLGLNHVDNVYDLMDTTGGASTFLFDQQFTDSPLDFTIFSIGSQDGWMLLLLTLGAG